VIFKFLRDSDAPRPPLAGRLVGLAVGVLLLSGAVYVALGVIEAVVPFLAVAVMYGVMFGRGRRQ
jgi:hypothetical protein